MLEGNQLLTLINRLRAAFIGRDEIAPFYGGLDLTPKRIEGTLPFGATVAPFVDDNNFSGLLMVSDVSNTGSVGVFACGGATVALLGESVGGVYTGSYGVPNRINVYYTGSPNFVLTVQNNNVTFRTIIISPIRIRPGA